MLTFVFHHLMQDLTLEQRVEMPICNCAKTVHYKWLQQSSNKITCLYGQRWMSWSGHLCKLQITIRGLKVALWGKGLTRHHWSWKLQHTLVIPSSSHKLRSLTRVQRISIQELCIGGSKLFGSTKRKFDLTLGSEYDYHRLNNLVNYSIPHPNTRSTRAHIDEFLTHDKNVVSHTTSMLESECPKY